MSQHAAAGAFSNIALAPEALPDFRAVALTPVVPGYRPYAMLVALLGWLVPGAAALLAALGALAAVLPDGFALPGFLLSGVLAVLAVASAGVAALDARRRAWALREHDLIYRSGVLWQRTVVVPFARIQHVETVSGPLERRFGLTRLKCYTAGGAGADLTVAGLDPDTARRVRQALLERIRDGKEDQAESHDAGAAGGSDGA